MTKIKKIKFISVRLVVSKATIKEAVKWIRELIFAKNVEKEVIIRRHVKVQNREREIHTNANNVDKKGITKELAKTQKYEINFCELIISLRWYILFATMIYF